MMISQLKRVLEHKRRVLVRNSDLNIIEDLEVSGAIKGEIVSREDLRAADGPLREVYSE